MNGFFSRSESNRTSDPTKVEELLDKIQDALGDSRTTKHASTLDTLRGIFNYVEVNREFTQRQAEAVDNIIADLQRREDR